MRSSTCSLRLVLRFVWGAALCLAFSWPASAAVNGYMKIEGSKQGPFKGEASRQGSNQWIPLLSVSYQAEATGNAASGKRQHKPVKITKEWGASSAQLQEALLRNEHLKEVVIEFVRPVAQGKEQVYQTITLTNAAVSSIQKSQGAAGKTRNQHELEEVSFTYERIEVTYAPGRKPATDGYTK